MFLQKFQKHGSRFLRVALNGIQPRKIQIGLIEFWRHAN